MHNTLYRTLAKLAVIAAGAGALGATASAASADVPHPVYSQGGNAGVTRSYACRTPWTHGVKYQHGAWGNYIDGCTVKLTCPATTGLYDVQRCDVSASSFIWTRSARGDRVTMNARTRRFEAGGHLYGWTDGSCNGRNRCEVDNSTVIAPGQSASVQCNGVRALDRLTLPLLGEANYGQDHCMVTLKYRALNRTSQQGSGQCGDWALYRRPDLNGIVNGNAEEWTAEARTAGRTVSKTPSPGALMVLQGGVMGAGDSTGHVAYVESVGPTSFVISEQNWNGIQTPTERTISTSDLPASGADFIR